MQKVQRCEEGCERFEARKGGDIYAAIFVYDMTNSVTHCNLIQSNLIQINLSLSMLFQLFTI